MREPLSHESSTFYHNFTYSMTQPIAISVKQLSKQFPKFKRYREMLRHPFTREYVQALAGVNLEVYKGELFGLLGPNGAGKTTLIKTLCTLILPETGSNATLNGFDLLTQGRQIRSQIGYVSGEERSFYWRLTGSQNLSFFAALHNLFGTEAQERIDFLLTLVGLDSVSDKMFKDYSTGMRQRLSLARGMLNLPQILFMDEPTRSLDPVTAETLRNFIKNKLIGELGTTVFLSSHDVMDLNVCDRVALLDHGCIKACDRLENLKHAPHKYTVQLVNPDFDLENKLLENNLVKTITPLPTEPANGLTCWQVELVVGGVGADLVCLLTAAGGAIHSFVPAQRTLAELFYHYLDIPQPKGKGQHG